jgi:cellulose synthase/poly-beta-1,6-N-acetylglucosamine synthase-like glycosyltransferase
MPEKAFTSLFFVMAMLWVLMIFYTILSWLFGYTLFPRNASIDISGLTWVFVVLSLISTSHWLFVQAAFLLANNKVVNYQRTASINWRKNNSSKPYVSIIIPAKNEEAVIKRTISNCLSQTYRNIEVVVICHNCTDSTHITATQIHDTRVRAFDYKTKEAGKGLALDFGAKKSRGEFILVLDSDGMLSSNFISDALPLFDNANNIAAVQGKIVPSNRYHSIITQLLGLEGDLFSVPYMTVKSLIDKRTPLGGTGYIIRKEILSSVGGFRNSLIDDFELSFRLFRKKYRISFAPLSFCYDEKPPVIGLMIKQRSRWVKGHFDMLKIRVPEFSDIMGNMYWFNPIFMICGLAAILIVSVGIIYHILFGTLPYIFSFVPIQIWIGTILVSYFLKLTILVVQQGSRGLRWAGHLALEPLFSQYWHVTLMKAFFVKSWANSKTTHGFLNTKDLSLVGEEYNLSDNFAYKNARRDMH